MKNPLLWTLVILNGLTFLSWVVRFGVLWFLDRILPPLQVSMYPEPLTEGLPALSVIVAARDEESGIEACVRSLRSQAYGNLEVIAINDRSSDATGSILDRLAEEFPGVTVGHVTDLQEGWFGKNNAMREGVERSTGEWLCFTDADCVQTATRSMEVAIRYAKEKEADFLSVLPAHRAETFWERVIQPACSAILMLWFSPMAVNSPKSKTAYANGAFMLIKRSCYEAIGGHEAVRDQINEDMHLARNAKAAGQRLAVVTCRDLYRVRMYGTLRDTWAGWTRIFSGSFSSLGHLLAAAGVIVWSTFVPWIGLALGLAGVAGTATLHTWLLWTAIGACVFQISSMSLFYNVSRIHFLYGLVYPLGALMGLGVVLNAAKIVAGSGAIRWRGTEYRGGASKALSAKA